MCRRRRKVSKKGDKNMEERRQNMLNWGERNASKGGKKYVYEGEKGNTPEGREDNT